MLEQVILVDEHDRELGASEKLSAHTAGRLHRAFSIFIFNSEGQLLLQRRAKAKYHSGGLWSNTCCGHPRPDESTPAAARRRLREEMNFDCELSAVFEFLYRAELANELIEYEYDHVFAGVFDGAFVPEASEVEDWMWTTPGDLRRDLRERPEAYTYWLGVALETDGWARLEAEYGVARGALRDAR